MKNVLIKGEVCYADEFECEFFQIMKDTEWKTLCKAVKEGFEDIELVEVYFGTNECVEFTSYKDWVDTFEVIEISDDEYKFIKNNFGESFGTGSGVLNNILEILEELKEDYGDESTEEKDE